jgi:hypothetical protein
MAITTRRSELKRAGRREPSERYAVAKAMLRYQAPSLGFPLRQLQILKQGA